MPSAAATRFCGEEVSEGDLRLIRQVVGQCGRLSRVELAATVCELLGWTRADGRLKTRECGDLLAELEAAGHLTLPELRAGRPRGSRTRVPKTRRGET